MDPSIPFARRVFLGAGLYGLVSLLPLLFLEERVGQAFPPPANHPEQYYGFLVVTLAWQAAFLVIARDVRRFRPLMPAAAAEKLLYAGAIGALFAADRVAPVVVAPAAVDLALGMLFLLAWKRCGAARAADG